VAVAAEFGGALPRAQALARAGAVLEELGLAGKAGTPASALTLADQKRLEVARALATAPRLLLLDEVMAGLTPAEVKAMVATLHAIRARHRLALLVVEHVMDALMLLVRRIVVLHHGQTIMEGPPEQVTQDPRVIAAYLGGPPS
jgi:branched-chain amino acid transport system ATP-binding protein